MKFSTLQKSEKGGQAGNRLIQHGGITCGKLKKKE